jgi:hypothetical protein
MNRPVDSNLPICEGQRETPGLQLSRIFPLQTLLFVLIFLCSAGSAVCAESPSAPAKPPAFGAAIPGRYSAVSSAVLQYRWFKFPALGVLTVDAPNRHFALVGLSQLGINVFELSETNGRLKCRMPGDLLKRHPQIAEGAAADVRQMFFDLVPPGGARRLPDARRNTAVFRGAVSGGTMEYRYDKSTGFLLEKRFSVPRKFLPGSSVVWRVEYGDYAAVGRSSYPRTIRFKQRARHYAIALFLKEMRVAR